VTEPPHHTIDIRLVAPPTALERPLFAPPVIARSRAMWVHLPRGPIALQIDMPVRPSFTPLAILGAGTLPLPLFLWLVLWSVGDSGPTAYLLVLVLPVTILVVVWLLTYAPFATRETLEIDSHVVVLRRGKTYLAGWNRSVFADVRVAEKGTPARLMGKSRFGAEPTLIWGFQQGGVSCLGGAGSGISYETASRILAEIQHFCAENPAGPGWNTAPWESGSHSMTMVRAVGG
jgi:hypothetical protein